MHGVLPAGAQRAMFPGVRNDSESSPRFKSDAAEADESIGVRSDTESSGWFADLARNLWPQKSAAAVQLYTRAALSTCQRWCRGGSDITGSALRDLIRSEEGGRIVAALVAGSNAKWVRDWKRGQLALTRLDEWKQLDLGIE